MDEGNQTVLKSRDSRRLGDDLVLSAIGLISLIVMSQGMQTEQSELRPPSRSWAPAIIQTTFLGLPIPLSALR